MHFKSRSARIALALCSAAAVVGAGVTTAVQAQAIGTTLAFTPPATSATIVDVDPALAPNQDLTYGFKVTGTSPAAPTLEPVRLSTLTGPTIAGAGLLFDRVPDSGSPDAGGFVSVSVGATSGPTEYVANDNIYVGATVPGTYTFRVFQDHNNNNAYDSGSDDTTPTFTLNVKHVTGTAPTTDDLDFHLSVPPQIGVGLPFTATATPGLTTTDTRGVDPDHGGVGALGYLISKSMRFTFTGSGGLTYAPDPPGTCAPVTPTFDGTSAFKGESCTVTHAGTATVTPQLAFAGGGPYTGTPANATAADNHVTATALAVTDEPGKVTHSGTNVSVKPAVESVTYTATVKDTDPDQSGNVVYFTLTPVAGAPKLTANGTLVSGDPLTGPWVYSAVTNASGVASLVVTSDKASAGTRYTVGAQSNGAADTTPLTATYRAPEATTFAFTNTPSSLVKEPGQSATITGQLKDQYGSGFQPVDPGDRKVTLTFTPQGGAAQTLDATLDIEGKFSKEYSPTPLPTAGTQTKVEGTVAGKTADAEYISWTSATAAGSITFTAPAAADFHPALQLGASPIAPGTPVTGTVHDAGHLPIPYKTVIITGGPGVYFADQATPNADHKLVTSIPATTNGSGVFTLYAFSTKAGPASVTATSGTVSATLTGTTSVAAVAGSAYKVTVNGAAGQPGQTLTLTGTVKDAFDNPAPGVVDLSLGTSTLGTINPTQVTANSEGNFAASFTSGSNTPDGTATLTATLHGLTANPAPDATWATAGVTIAAGVYQAQSEIKVSAAPIDKVRISGPASRVGPGNVRLTGTTTAGKTVKIYSKPAGSGRPFGLVGVGTAGSDGRFSKVVRISGSRTFIASINGDAIYSNEVTVRVVPPLSTIRLTGRNRGHGIVRLAADGGPNGRGVLAFYKLRGKKWVLIKALRTGASGDYAFNYRSGRGTFTFRAVYTAPGRRAAGANVRVRVT